MRDVVERLESMDLAWYLTGSEALAAYAIPRQTLDTDIVLDADVAALDELARALNDRYYYAEPLRFGDRTMASLVHVGGGAKIDLIIRDPDRWGLSAVRRRVRWDHPSWGSVWNSSLEDLILAKLEWSEGTSELQLGDCRTLLRLNRTIVDDRYLDEWAGVLGVDGLLRGLRAEDSDAS